MRRHRWVLPALLVVAVCSGCRFELERGLAHGEVSGMSSVRIAHEPMLTSGGGDWLDVVAGFGGTCMRSRLGTVSCMGDNRQGQLGGASLVGSMVPTVLGTPDEWRDVALGETHGCG